MVMSLATLAVLEHSCRSSLYLALFLVTASSIVVSKDTVVRKGVLCSVEGKFHHRLWQLPQCLYPDGGGMIVKLTGDVALHCKLPAILQPPGVISGSSSLS